MTNKIEKEKLQAISNLRPGDIVWCWGTHLGYKLKTEFISWNGKFGEESKCRLKVVAMTEKEMYGWNNNNNGLVGKIFITSLFHMQWKH